MIPYVHHIAGGAGTNPVRGGERGLEATFSDLAPHHVHTHKYQLSGLIPLRISPGDARKGETHRRVLATLPAKFCGR